MLAAVMFVPSAAHAADDTCNGAVRLCSCSLGGVALATTHNSIASTANLFAPDFAEQGDVLGVVERLNR